MSILLRAEIEKEYERGAIILNPYIPENLGPNSYDVTLHNTLTVYVIKSSKFSPRHSYLDSRGENVTKTFTIPPDGFILKPGILYIGCTVEEAGSDYYIPMYEGRSSMARLGIQSHISAGYGDIGFKKQWTLEITVTHPVKIYPGMAIGQVYFHHVNPAYNLPQYRYNGKYVNQSGPTPSLSYMDNDKKNSVPTDMEEVLMQILRPHDASSSSEEHSPTFDPNVNGC